MKLLSIITLSFLLLSSCDQTWKKSADNTAVKKSESVEVVEVLPVDTTFTFENYEPGKKPAGWSQYFTGKGDTTDWKIIVDDGNKVLAQLSADNPNYHFNEIVFDELRMKNVELKVKIKGVTGKMDQGGGFVWRFTNADNYYVVRANPLEDNIVLYKVENGKRTDLALIDKGKTYGVDVESLGNDWNVLGLTVVDDLFTVFLNDQQLFRVRDNTFENEGKIGLWTKADAVTYFDDFQVKSINTKNISK